LADQDFENFFRSEITRATSVARAIVRDKETAEDLVVEGFIRTYVHWARVRRMKYPAGWLLRVTINLALDNQRRRDLRAATEPLPISAASDLVELREVLLPGLRALSKKQREVVVLRYIGDLKELEIATTMGMTVGTVKTHLHRALRKLRVSVTESA
jgi:RNA polymerase sigma-70 factor (sigma-E family)